MKIAFIMLCALGVARVATADAPIATIWPPPLESLRNGEACAERPACDLGAPLDPLSAPLADADRFVRVLSTTASDCSRVVAVSDHRADLGNVVAEPLGVRLSGTCGVNKRGEVIGAVRGGVLATCQQTERPFGAMALEIAVIELSPSGAGKAHVRVSRLPWMLVGQSSCEIALDVRIQERAGTLPDVAAPQPARN